MFSPLPSDMRPYSATGHSTPQRIQTSGLESLANGSQYALQHLHSMAMAGNPNIGPTVKGSSRVRHHPYENQSSKSRDSRQRNLDSGSDTKSTTGPVRRRISRACDQCNQLRTKCDGMSPCAHCVEFSLACEYFRERKKRGKASRKDIAQQQAAAAAAASGTGNGHNENSDSPGYSSEQTSPTVSSGHEQEPLKGSRSDLPPPPRPPARTLSASGSISSQHQNGLQHELHRTNSMSMMTEQMGHSQHMAGIDGQPRNHMGDSPGSLSSFGIMQDYNRHSMSMIPMNNGQPDMNGQSMGGIPPPMGSPSTYNYNDSSFHLMGQEPQSSTFSFGRPGESPLGNFMATSPVAGSPGWLSLPSPNGGSYPSQHLLNPATSLKYPVLQPLLPKLTSVIPTSLACDLLDLYFSSSSSAHAHPLSPYLLGFVFRKRSFLHPTRPRYCSSALLASMLWVAAQTSEAPFLTSPPAARGKICQKLLELTVSLLKPLIHGTGTDGPSNLGMNTVINGVALGGLGVATDNDHMTSESGGTGTLDDVATYFHLATVISASEYKAASLRWWNVAWSLARELKLGRELPPNLPQQRGQGQDDDEDAHGDVDLEMRENNGQNGIGQDGSLNSQQPGTHTEEEREERRRMWWLLYTMDRHLALCYNRPLFLLDIECADLFQPVNDDVWQAGEFFTGSSSLFPDPNSTQPKRHRGPAFECTSHSIFGYFTPLMTILGEIVDLNHARAHPRFGLAFRSATEWDNQTAEITQQLEAYGRSLKEFEARCTTQLQAEQQEGDRSAEAATPSVPSVRSINSNTSRITENIIHTKTVLAYGTHVMHVLHILLTGKWDPISLLDDSDLWISSQSFIFATQHAVSAAEAVSEILEYDPDLSFMPFFFGIYLLQGSFLLLLIADKLQGEASQSVVGACEVVVRAVEACVVTLNTEYQRNFRKVMRSALSQVKGRIPEDFGEQQQRRREVLSLYRWTGDGTGLAL